MICYRIVRSIYQHDISGEGAEKYGGRWNSIGTPALYCCENRSLALLEILVNLHPSAVVQGYTILTIEFPDSYKIYEPSLKDLPKDWDVVPLSNTSQLFGDVFIEENKFLAMKVPSSIMRFEYNFVLNPKHTGFEKVKIKERTSYTIDTRL